MTPNIFATHALPVSDQFEAWRQWYAPVFDVTAGQASSDGFPAEIHLWMLGGLAINRTIASSAHVVRSRRHLRHEPVDHWVISYCAPGAHFARTADIEVEVPPGVPYLWSWDKNSCTSERMSIASSSCWRATRSVTWRRCSTPPSELPSTRRSDGSLVTI